MSNIDRDAEIDLLKQKLAEKEEMIRGFLKTEDHLVPLPNGDLHRGMRNRKNVTNIDVDTEVIPETMGNPLDRAMAKILKAANGGHQLTCLWCGIQFGTNSESAIREHLKKDHPSTVEGWEKQESQVLAMALAEANARLAEAESAK